MALSWTDMLFLTTLKHGEEGCCGFMLGSLIGLLIIGIIIALIIGIIL